MRKDSKRAVGQTWGLKSGGPGLVLIVGRGQTSYGDAWRILTVEPQAGSASHPAGNVSLADDVWFEIFAERVA